MPGHHLWRYKQAPEALGQAAFEFGGRCLHISPVHYSYCCNPPRQIRHEVDLPVVVGSTVRVDKGHVVRGEWQDSDSWEDHTTIYTPVIQKFTPGLAIIAGRRTAIGIGILAREDLLTRQVGAAKPREPTRHHHLFTNDELLAAARPCLAPNSAILEGLPEPASPAEPR